MSIVLDSRVIRMTRWLLDQTEPRSTADLAADLGLSERVVRYRLGSVERYLKSEGATLTRRRGSGLVVEVDDDRRIEILADLDERVGAPRVYTPEEREHLLVAGLLWEAPNVIPLESLTADLEVSKTSARRDLQRAEPWLENNSVPLVRKPGKGIVVAGTERQIRRAMVQLFLEAVPADVLEELSRNNFDEAHMVNVRVPTGIRDRLATLPLQECSRAVVNCSDQLGSLAGNSELVLSMYLAVTVARCQTGHRIQIDPGYQVSLIEHPAASAATALCRALAGQGVIDIQANEVPGITEYLLGLNALADVKREEVNISAMLDEVLAVAALEIHPSLAEDPELRHGLALHLGRLAVRLRHGLPVHNPLLAEVAHRYPDVHAVAGKVAELLARHFDGRPISADEVGFITMYLSGAMERAHLRPRRKALVVCPTGMATAWVLVSRVQAEFPELSISEVLSARSYGGLDVVEFDVVISTVALPDAGVPVVVVSPLLSQSDVARVSALL